MLQLPIFNCLNPFIPSPWAWGAMAYTYWLIVSELMMGVFGFNWELYRYVMTYRHREVEFNRDIGSAPINTPILFEYRFPNHSKQIGYGFIELVEGSVRIWRNRNCRGAYLADLGDSDITGFLVAPSAKGGV